VQHKKFILSEERIHFAKLARLNFSPIAEDHQRYRLGVAMLAIINVQASERQSSSN